MQELHDAVRADVLAMVRTISAELSALDGQQWLGTGNKGSTDASLYGPHGEHIEMDVDGFSWRRTGKMSFRARLISSLDHHLRTHERIDTLHRVWNDDPRAAAAEVLDQQVPLLRKAAEEARASREADLALVEQLRSILGVGFWRLSPRSHELHVEIGPPFRSMSVQLFLTRGRDAQLEMRVPATNIPAVLQALAPLLGPGCTTPKAE